jgi:hypothetical protein
MDAWLQDGLGGHGADRIAAVPTCSKVSTIDRSVTEMAFRLSGLGLSRRAFFGFAASSP